jgi:16S rRNA (adenine1518-N6/adenine1519-N6)-dimethyltransferase
VYRKFFAAYATLHGVAQSKQQIQARLALASTEPRKRFGQNFMIDQNLVRLVADAGSPTPGDTIIEVGPGTGTLTEELLARGSHVIAVEIDRDLAAMLRQHLGDAPNFSLIEGDALAGKHGVNSDLLHAIESARRNRPGGAIKLVANLPYNIASPLIIELLNGGVDLLAFTVQKEVADRLRATEKDDAYGPLSVVAGMLAKVEVLRTLPPQAFWPPPKIDSALVRMTRADRLGERAREFSTFVHQIFSFRRKTLRKALIEAGHDPQVLGKLGIDPSLRPENLSPETLLSLFSAARAQR